MTKTPKRRPAVKKEPRAKPANDNSVAAGRSRAARSGVKGEKLVEQYNAAAADVVRLFKIPTPTRRVPSRGGWSMVFTSRSTVDYCGWLCGSGRHVAAEVKTVTAKKKFAMSELEAHQRAHLDAAYADGAVALLIVVYGVDHQVCLIPWEDVRDLKSLDAFDLHPYRTTAETYRERFAAMRGPAVFNVQPDGPGDPVEPAVFAALVGRGVKVR